MMNSRSAVLLLAAALVAAACSDAGGPGAPRFATAAGTTGITLDQQTAIADDPTAWGSGETHVGKGFQPNPHLGDAIVATFFWKGTSNTIVEVSDHLCDVANTPVGNTYALVDYVTIGGNSLATYVATNVQGFPDPAPTSDQLLCVHAIFSNSINEGGVMLSAYSGVAATQALGAHHAATGTASTTAPVDPGAISVAAGAVVYAVATSDGIVGSDPPPGFTNVTEVDDRALKTDGEYDVVASGGTVDPRWTWYFTSSHSWLAAALALNPTSGGTTNQPPVAGFTSSCGGLACTFTDGSSDPDGSISAYNWTFGDGATSTTQNPSHTYGTSGTYTVT